ncbi:RNA polymerase sigma factor [Chitinophaga parva]|nr:RNA polymerase sigma-70 factor [Chitinophaga parva]
MAVRFHVMNEQFYLQRIASYADQEAFEWLYNQHALPVFHFVYAILRQKQAAEEIVNDIFVRLWQQRASLPEITHLRAYLLRAGRNGASNHLRSQQQAATIDLDQVSAAHIHFSPSPEQLSISRETAQALSRGIDQLPPKCKLIFKLIKEDGLKYREAAALLDVSVKTVETQMTLALRRLQELLLQAGIPVSR